MQKQPSSGQDTKPQLTPHQLYNYHIQHPNEPITDEDIRNLKIDSGGVYKDHQLTGEEALTGLIPDEENKESDIIEKENRTDEHPMESPYDILGNS